MEKFTIWGTGTIGKLIYKFIKEILKKEVVCFIDDFLNKKNLFGIPIVNSVDSILDKNIKIIISFNSQVEYKIPDFVKNFGIEESLSVYDLKKNDNFITLTEFIRLYPEFLKFFFKNHKFLWWDGKKLFNFNKQFEYQFIDKKSKNLFFKLTPIRKLNY